MSATPVHLDSGDALIIIDVQNDYLPGGVLGVARGRDAIPVINEYIGRFDDNHLQIFALRDWHPEKHCSFQAQGGRWPMHCVADTFGAAFPDELALPADALVLPKGEDLDKDACSAFNGTRLLRHLREFEIERLFIGGLAANDCLLATIRDAVSHGFEVFLLEDATRPAITEPGVQRLSLDQVIA